MSYGDLARAASTQGKVLERQGLANQRLSKVHASSYFNGVLKLGKISSTRIPAQCFFFFFFFSIQFIVLEGDTLSYTTERYGEFVYVWPRSS